jgi:hypothetical protein
MEGMLWIFLPEKSDSVGWGLCLHFLGVTSNVADVISKVVLTLWRHNFLLNFSTPFI